MCSAGVDLLVKDFSLGYVKPDQQVDPRRMARILRTVAEESEATQRALEDADQNEVEGSDLGQELGAGWGARVGDDRAARRQLGGSGSAASGSTGSADPLIEVQQVTPRDPLYSQQWHLSKIMADYAWSVTTGSSHIIIAVVDTGVDLTHPDIAPNLWVNTGEIPGNGIDDDGNGGW